MRKCCRLSRNQAGSEAGHRSQLARLSSSPMRHWLNEWSDWCAERLGVDPDTFWNIVTTVAIVLFFTILQRVVRRALARTISDPAVRYGANKVIGYAIGLLGVIIILRTWVQGSGSLVTYL